jgi:hypothetical protein
MSKDISGDTFNKKINGRITETPPPRTEGVYYIQAPVGKPIEGVKVTDGEKVVLSDKNGFYEIETAKRSLVFSKENYVSETFDTNFPIGVPFKKNIVLKSSGVNKSTSENDKTSPFVWGAIALAVVGLGWWYYKSKNK